MLDGQEIGETVVGIVRGFLDREVVPLRAENDDLKRRVADLEARAAPEKGEPGPGVDPKALAEMVAAEVERAIAKIPTPKDGENGVGLAGALIDRAGHLRVRMSDGTDHDLGPVIGKDGEDGKDGHDGFGFEDMDACVLDDDRTIELSFRRGDEEKAFTFKWPVPMDRGVWNEKGEYERGDGTTWAGSFWIAQRDNPGKPDTADSGWRMAVKKGRDGKDSKPNG